MQILPPYDPGGNLGSSIGSGISSGLQLLAQNKLEDMKQDRKNKLLKKTQAERESRLKERGYPGWLAYEDPSVFKEYMSQFAPSGQEGIDRTLGGGGQSPTGLDLLGGGQESPSAETTPQPTEQMPAGAVEPQGLPTLKSYKEFLQSNPEIRKNAPKLREKSYKQYQDEWHKRKTEAQGEANTNLKRSQQAHTIFNPIREKADKAREDLGSIRIVNELLNKGDFTNPLIAKFYDMLPGGFLEAFKSKDTKALQGLRGDFFATMAKGFYPLSDSDVQEIYKTLISPANTVDQNKMLNGLAELKTAGPILKEKILNNVENDPKYANKTPYDIERMANKLMQKNLKICLKRNGKVLRMKYLPNPLSLKVLE